MKKILLNYFVLVNLLLLFAFSISALKPTLYLIGDSTVRNGSGRGEGGLWGWGNFINSFVDTTQLIVQNKALGGTSSRSFWSAGHWDKVVNLINAGDIVMIQFGHNDGNPTTLKGISDDSLEVLNPYTQKMIMAHTFGWNIRKYITETKAKGGIPIVVSLVPRNLWKEGKVNRVAAQYVAWGKEVAMQEKVDFIDLNKIIADHYDELGEQKVKSDFFNAKDPVHTIEAGAKFNAACVIEGIKALPSNPLKKYLIQAQ